MPSITRTLSSKRWSIFSKRKSAATESVISYSSLSTAASEVPADNPESFDRELWIRAQIDRKDPRLDIPRGGLSKPDAEWYDALDEDTTAWASETLYRGFDVTIREYLQAEADLVAFLHDTDSDGVPWCSKEWTYTVSVRTRYIYDGLRSTYAWLADETERGVPSWFLEDGLAGWMERTARIMREDPEFCKYSRKEPREWVTRCQDKRIDSFHEDYDDYEEARDQDLNEKAQ